MVVSGISGRAHFLQSLGAHSARGFLLFARRPRRPLAADMRLPASVFKRLLKGACSGWSRALPQVLPGAIVIYVAPLVPQRRQSYESTWLEALQSLSDLCSWCGGRPGGRLGDGGVLLLRYSGLPWAAKRTNRRHLASARKYAHVDSSDILNTLKPALLDLEVGVMWCGSLHLLGHPDTAKELGSRALFCSSRALSSGRSQAGLGSSRAGLWSCAPQPSHLKGHPRRDHLGQEWGRHDVRRRRVELARRCLARWSSVPPVGRPRA
jgi:hypothetical protein